MGDWWIPLEQLSIETLRERVLGDQAKFSPALMARGGWTLHRTSSGEFVAMKGRRYVLLHSPWVPIIGSRVSAHVLSAFMTAIRALLEVESARGRESVAWKVRC